MENLITVVLLLKKFYSASIKKFDVEDFKILFFVFLLVSQSMKDYLNVANNYVIVLIKIYDVGIYNYLLGLLKTIIIADIIYNWFTWISIKTS